MVPTQDRYLTFPLLPSFSPKRSMYWVRNFHVLATIGSSRTDVNYSFSLLLIDCKQISFKFLKMAGRALNTLKPEFYEFFNSCMLLSISFLL